MKAKLWFGSIPREHDGRGKTGEGVHVRTMGAERQQMNCDALYPRGWTKTSALHCFKKKNHVLPQEQFSPKFPVVHTKKMDDRQTGQALIEVH